MMKLTEEQKEIVRQRYSRLSNLVIDRMERIKLELTFEEAMDFAYDIICEQAE